jgi:hypothetical protein
VPLVTWQLGKQAQGRTVSGVCSLGLESTASVAQVGELRLQGGRWLAQGHIASSGTEGQAQRGERSVKGWASAPEAASLAPVLGARPLAGSEQVVPGIGVLGTRQIVGEARQRAA